MYQTGLHVRGGLYLHKLGKYEPRTFQKIRGTLQTQYRQGGNLQDSYVTLLSRTHRSGQQEGSTGSQAECNHRRYIISHSANRTLVACGLIFLPPPAALFIQVFFYLFQSCNSMPWSERYKKSIDCAHPRGFSQRAHCRSKLLSERRRSRKRSKQRRSRISLRYRVSDFVRERPEVEFAQP